MTLTLDPTVGGQAANSYLSVTDANTILDGVPNATAWTSAVQASREVALAYATQLLDAVSYQGWKASTAQALQWPRQTVRDPDAGPPGAGYGSKTAGSWGVYLDYTKIPKRIQRGCAMLALEILRAGTSDVWGVEPTANVAQKSVAGAVTTTFVDPSARRYGLRQYPSVWREIAPLTMGAHGRSVERA